MQIEKGRIGNFFLFVGLFVLIVFFFSDQNENPQLSLFLIGLVATVLGIYLIRKDWKPPTPSSRFRMFKNANRQNTDKPGEKK